MSDAYLCDIYLALFLEGFSIFERCRLDLRQDPPQAHFFFAKPFLQ